MAAPDSALVCVKLFPSSNSLSLDSPTLHKEFFVRGAGKKELLHFKPMLESA